MSKLVYVAILVGVFLTGMFAHAQTSPKVIEQTVVVQQSGGTVIAGTDLGFRIERYKGSTPVGRLVARIDGKWVEVEDTIVVKKLTMR